MSDLDSFEIRDTGDKDPASGPSRPVWPIAVVVILALAVGAYFYFRSPEPEGPVVAPQAAPVPAAAEDEEEAPLELPPLAESDDVVRELVAALSSHPEMAAMLIPDNLVRRFTAAVVNVAEGTSPRSHLPHLRPEAAFAAAGSGGRTYIAEDTYQRFDTVATVFASLDTEGTAELYRSLKPLIQESYRELGYPDGDFDQVLATAIGHLLDTPIVDGPIYVEQGVSSYALSDPELESLSDAQKQILRMGPENTKRVQAKLAELVAELELPPAG